MASPLVQVGPIEDITQHVLAPLGNLVADGVWWDVGLCLIVMVVFMVKPLLGDTEAFSDGHGKMQKKIISHRKINFDLQTVIRHSINQSIN